MKNHDWVMIAVGLVGLYFVINQPAPAAAPAIKGPIPDPTKAGPIDWYYRDGA